MDDSAHLRASRGSDLRRLPRRRIEKACDTCRRRKERCNGGRPVCSNCRSAGRDCHYTTESKRRGLPEGWVRALEKLWTIASLRSPGIEEDVVSVILEGLSDPEETNFAALWTDESNEQSLLGKWKASLLAQELERLLPTLERMPHQRLNAPSFNQYRLFAKDQQLNHDVGARIPSNTVEPAMVVDLNEQQSDEQPHEQSTVDLESNLDIGNQQSLYQVQTLPPGTHDMVESFFTWTQYWIPIVEKHQIYRVCHQWDVETSDASKGDRACLLAIIAHESQRQIGKLDAETSQTSTQIQKFAQDMFVESYRQIPNSYSDCQIGHVQALLLLTLTKLGAGLPEDSWLLVGQASRITFLLISKVNPQETSHKRSTTTLPGRLQHSLLACFILDLIISLRLDLRPHIRTSDIRDFMQLTEDGIEEWSTCPPFVMSHGFTSEPLLTISTFNRLVRMTEFLDRMCEQSTFSGGTLQRISEIDTGLRNWDQQLLSSFRLRHAVETTAHNTILPHQLTIHLLHLATLIMKTCILRHLPQTSFDPLDSASTLIQKVELLISTHTKNLDSRSIPVIWAPILHVLLSQIQELQSLRPFNASSEFAHSLKNMISEASSKWTCFSLLQSRIDSIHQTSSDHSNATVFRNPLLRDSSIPVDALNVHGTASVPPRSDNLNDLSESGQFDRSLRPPSQQDDTLYQPTQNFILNPQVNSDSAGIDGSDDATTSVLDFVTMDALTWDGLCPESFQHLGFSDLENTSSGLQSFFQGM